MQLFEQLADILTEKKNRLQENEEYEKEFVPYIVQRWISMYSTSLANIANCSSNLYWKVMDDKQMWYKLFSGVIPKCSTKRIKYIKKKQENKKNKYDIDIVKYLANSYELSEREIKQYLDTETIDIKNIKKQLE